MKVKTIDKNAKYFVYLDYLRESGKTNMFAAPLYLAKAFDIPRAEATQIFLEWTRTYDQ
jgi:hypothetical protein